MVLLAGISMMALGPQTAAAGPAGKPDYGSVIRARQHNVAPLPAAVTSTGTRNRPRQLLEQPAAAQPLAVAHMTQSFGGAWSELGPAPITDARCCGAQPPDFNGAVSGKINALAVDPTNANVLYAGAGEGGVWKTMDAGSTWAPLTDDRESMAIGSLAIDTTGQVIYAGTGEQLGIDSLSGQGILKSVDGGTHWVLLGAATFAGRSVRSIAIDRTTSGNTQRVFAATDVGLFLSTDGGTSWNQNTQILSVTLPIAGPVSGSITQVVQDPVTPAKFWASISDLCKTEGGNIAISTDGGNTWSDALDFPHAPLGTRIGLGVGRNGVAYAALAACEDKPHGILDGQFGELDRTTDGGATWQAIPVNSPGLVDYFAYPGGVEPGGWHSNVIGIDPVNPSHVIFGGVRIMVTIDGGASFRLIGPMEAGSVVHPDQHAIAFTGLNSFYIANDGGVWKSANFGGLGTSSDWMNLNAGLRVTQFYAGTALDTSHYLGGTQDNGTPGVFPGGPPQPAWRTYHGGDGGYAAIDPTPGSSTIYAEYPQGFIYRGSTTPTSSPDYPYDAWEQASPCGRDTDPACAEPAAWAAPFIMDPTNPSRLFAGLSRVYATVSGGVPPGSASWAAISPSLTSGQQSGYHSFDHITAMALGPPSARNTILAGSRDGLLWRTADLTTWTSVAGNLPTPTAANRGYIADWIRAIAINPDNSSEVWVALGGLNVGHVWHTTNIGAPGGPTWADVSGSGATAIPNTVALALIVDPLNPSTLYLGTASGTLVCTACGGASPSANWAQLGTGLPNVPVDFLSLTKDAGNIVAWTHGRGAWQMSRPSPTTGPVVSFDSTALDFGPVSVGTASPPRTVTLTNAGNADLHVQGVRVAGVDAGDFAGVDRCGGRVLVAGGSCTVEVRFAPRANGPRDGALSFSDDAVGSPQLTALHGVGKPIGGSFHPLTPARILDTRTSTGQHPGPLGAGQELTLQVTGQGGVPSSGVSGVVMNVTVTDTTAGSYLTVYPTGVARPVASNLNWGPGTTVPNLVEVGLGSGGQLTFFNAAGSTNVLADVAGWVGTEDNSADAVGLLKPLQPARLLDTRSSNGGHPGAVRAGETVNLQVTGRGGVPWDVEAVVLNVTATNATAASYLTVWPAGRERPNASNLNFVAGQTVPNRVMVEVSEGGQVSFYNPAGSVDVIVDVNGAFTNGAGSSTGGRFVAHAPARVYDSRGGDGPLGAGQTRGLATPYDPTKVVAVVLNVTVTDTSRASYLTVWPGQSGRPNASDLNWAAGVTVPNLVVVALGTDGSLAVFNAAGSANFIVDEVGVYALSTTGSTVLAPVRWSTRPRTPAAGRSR